MAIYQPYFYVIQDNRNGTYYAGSKYGKDADPTNFMKPGGYLTSSNTIKAIIEQHGHDTFIIRKIKKFENAEDVYNHETKFLMRVDAKNNERFYNGHNNNWKSFPNPEIRKRVGEDGLTSYQKGARKAVATKRQTVIDGKNTLQLAYEKALDKNPDLHSIRTQNAKLAMLKINPVTGMTKHQENGLKISGENNPSKKPENAIKISEGKKREISLNREKWLERQKNLNKKLSTEKDENGLTARDKHSKWMTENNPTKNTKWYNDGATQKRIGEGELVPVGFVLGRLYKKR